MTSYDNSIMELLKGETPKQKFESLKQTQQRIEDLEQAIIRFCTHLEELGGNYTTEELFKLRNLVTVSEYHQPVSYHDNWSGKEMTTEND